MRSFCELELVCRNINEASGLRNLETILNSCSIFFLLDEEDYVICLCRQTTSAPVLGGGRLQYHLPLEYTDNYTILGAHRTIIFQENNPVVAYFGEIRQPRDNQQCHLTQ